MTEESLYLKFRETIKHGVIYGVGSSLTTIVGILLVPVYTNYLSTAEYGVLSLITITATIVTTVFLWGLIAALFRSYYEHEDEKRRVEVVGTALALMAVSGAAVAVFGHLLAPHISNLVFSTAAYTTHFRLIFYITALAIIYRLPMQVFRIHKRSELFSAVNVTHFILSLAFILYLVVVSGEGVLGVLKGKLFSQAITTALVFYLARSKISLGFSLLEASRMLAFGLPLVVRDISTFVLAWFDRYLLNILASVSDVGVYTLGFNLSLGIDLLMRQPLSLVWIPMLYPILKHSNVKNYHSRMLTYVFYYGFLISLPISFYSKPLLQMVSDPGFWIAYRVVPVLCLAGVVNASTLLVVSGLLIEKKTKTLTATTIAAAAANIVLNVIFIPVYGMVGAAYTTLASYLLVFALGYYYADKAYPVRFEWTRITKLTTVTVGLLAAGYFIDCGFMADNILKTAMIISYPLILYPLGFYQPEELNKLREIIPRIPGKTREVLGRWLR